MGRSRRSRRSRPRGRLLHVRSRFSRAAAGTAGSAASWWRTLHPPPEPLHPYFAHEGKRMRECVFRGNRMLIDDVNPRLQDAWKKDGRNGHFPFAAAQKVWRTEHCPRINPYGSEDCPYDRSDCTLAYYAAMIRALDAHPDNFVAFSRTVALNSGVDRADNKPLARDRVRTNGHPVRTRGVRAGPGEGPVDDLAKPAWLRLGELADAERSGLHRSPGLTRVGTLLGTDDVRSHLAPRGRDEGEESADDDGDGERDLRPSPPLHRLGYEPPSGDPDLHQGGE